MTYELTALVAIAYIPTIFVFILLIKDIWYD